jgi:hypothetical protein
MRIEHLARIAHQAFKRRLRAQNWPLREPPIRGGIAAR